jgi:hypothetical protein
VTGFPTPPEGAAPAPRGPRRWGRVLAATGVLLVAAAAVVLHSPWMSVRQIEILGATHADVAGRLAAAGVGKGAIMLWVDTGRIEAEVAEDPWVREVRVERIFPSRLVVEVLEQTPALWVRGEETWMLVARSGRVVEAASTAGEGLLRAEVWYADHRPGEDVDDPAWGQLVELALALSPELAARARVTSEGGELWIEADGYRARLGPAEDLADKGRVFEALLGSDLPEGAVIDLVSPTRPGITTPDSTQGEPVVEG